MKWLPVVLALLAAACDRAVPDPQMLRAGVPALPPSWGDPYRAEGTPSSYTWTALFDGLTTLDADGHIAPALATRWASSDGKRWTFELRHGVRFANGVAFDAAAAKASFDWLKSPAGKGSVIGSRLRDVAAVLAPAPDRLVVILKRPDAVFPKRLPSVAIVEPGAWVRLGSAGFAKAPVGTGPYRLVRFDERRRRALLVAHDGGSRRPGARAIELIELADEAVRQQALISGDIDIARVGIDEIGYLKARGVRLVRSPSMQVMSLAFVVAGRRAAPLADVRVRQALNLAVDRQAIARTLLRGLGAPASQPGARGTLGHDPALPAIPHDPERARALLAAAGHARGFTLRADVVVGSLPADALIYQAMARQLAAVGVDLELRAIPFPVFLRRYLANDWGDADAFGLSWNAAPYNDIQRPLENFSCLKKPKPFFCDKALAAGIRAAGSELEPSRRLALLKALAAAHQRAAPALFLVEQIDLIGVGPRIAGPVPIANRVPVYEALRMR